MSTLISGILDTERAATEATTLSSSLSSSPIIADEGTGGELAPGPESRSDSGRMGACVLADDTPYVPGASNSSRHYVASPSLPILGPEEWIKQAEDDSGGEELLIPFGIMPPITRGRVTLLGGATETGKTTLGLQIFREVLDNGYSGAYITLEMTPADLYRRFSPQFGSDEECDEWIRERNAHVSESYANIGEVEGIIVNGNYDFVAVDHAHEFPYKDRMDLGNQVMRIYRLAPKTDTAIMLMAQMRRPNLEFPRPPSKHDYLEWGGFEQMASVAMALYREDEHSTDTELYCLKNRFGPKPEPLSLSLNHRTVTFERRW